MSVNTFYQILFMSKALCLNIKTIIKYYNLTFKINVIYFIFFNENFYLIKQIIYIKIKYDSYFEKNFFSLLNIKIIL